MEIFYSSVEVIAPLFFYMVIGWAARQSGLLSEHDSETLSNVVLRLLLPALLFRCTYDSDIAAALRSRFLPFGFACEVVIFALLLLILPRIEPDRKKQLSLYLCNQQVNSMVYGIPLATAIVGQQGVSEVGVVVGVVVILESALMITGVEMLRGAQHSIKAVLQHILKSPLLFALASGALVGLVVDLPDMVYTPIVGLASACGPLAFLTLGASFSFVSSSEHRQYIMWSSLYKLIVSPLVFLSLAAFLLHLRGGELVAALCLFGTPSGSSNMALAEGYGGDGPLAGELTVFSTVLSLGSVLLFVFLFKLLRFF